MCDVINVENGRIDSCLEDAGSRILGVGVCRRSFCKGWMCPFTERHRREWRMTFDNKLLIADLNHDLQNVSMLGGTIVISLLFPISDIAIDYFHSLLPHFRKGRNIHKNTI
jgi:hypothetical protein